MRVAVAPEPRPSRLSLVAALGSNRVIGVANRLPWHLPADMKHFRALTMGHPVLMGRKTHESIGRALPGRLNIVLTRDRALRAEGCKVVGSLDEALRCCADVAEAMIIGGASLYAQTLGLAATLHLTCIHHAFEGDEYFPAIDASEWRETERQDFAADEKNLYDFSFMTLVRQRPDDPWCSRPENSVRRRGAAP